ncbi:MAG: hypothetical protein WBW69_17790 [Candidatus Korobacteraceae bacterium]
MAKNLAAAVEESMHAGHSDRNPIANPAEGGQGVNREKLLWTLI